MRKFKLFDSKIQIRSFEQKSPVDSNAKTQSPADSNAKTQMFYVVTGETPSIYNVPEKRYPTASIHNINQVAMFIYTRCISFSVYHLKQ